MDRTESDQIASITKKINNICLIVCLILFMVPTITMFVVGIVMIDECPIERNIPIYLIVAGAVGILSRTALPLLNRKLDLNPIRLLMSVLYLFEFIWIIVGSVWVYSIFEPNHDPSNGPYCEEYVYNLTIGMISLHWLILFLVIVFVLVVCCWSCFSKSKE